MNVILKIVAAVAINLVLSAYSCEKQGANIDGKEDAFTACSSDEDCTVFKADCCGCNQGGKQRAIAKKLQKTLQNELKNRCQDKICAQVISDDISCSQTPVCVNNTCLLE